ncbi:MAG TPA: sulfur carrier protein ThiS [Dermatophilaceae bacterium]|nr:sulfur carrier protein ThiS [Dermatophilaceae bacterium]
MRITVNGTPTDVSAGSTLADLVAALGLPARGIALAVDGEVVHRQHWPTTALLDRSAVEVVTAMQGG